MSFSFFYTVLCEVYLFSLFVNNVVGVNIVKKCTFFHIGSTRELLNLLGDGNVYVDCVDCELELAGGNVVKVYDLVDWVSRDSEIAGRSAAKYALDMH